MQDIIISGDSLFIVSSFYNILRFFVVRHEQCESKRWCHEELLNHRIHVADTSEILQSDMTSVTATFSHPEITLTFACRQHTDECLQSVLHENIEILRAILAKSHQEPKSQKYKMFRDNKRNYIALHT